jgi:Zn-dependent protease with chaperone function
MWSYQAIWTLSALPGVVAWNLLRTAGRFAEYDADRYAVQSGPRHSAKGELQLTEQVDQFAAVLATAASGSSSDSLGLLPVSGEHPSVDRRIKRLKKLALRPPL